MNLLSEPVTMDTVEAFCAAAIDMANQLMVRMGPPLTIPLHRLTLRVYSAVPDYGDVVHERLHHRAPDKAYPRLDVVVVSPESGLVGAPPRWGESVLSLRHLELALAGTRYRISYFHAMRFLQIQDLEAGIGLQWMFADDALPPWDKGAPLRSFLHWTYGRMGLRLAHAGTLGIGGNGVLLAGKGGSGKSGTVTGGIMQGFDSVGDDYVLIEMKEEGVVAHALFPNLKQDIAGLARLGLSQRLEPRTPNWQGKLEFYACDIGAKDLVDRLLIKAVIVPALVGGEATRMEPLSQAHAMVALAPTGLFQMPADRDAGASFYADMIRSLPARRMMLGRDPAGVNAAIRALLEPTA